ncbi:pseudouridine synthase [Panus rudis PR-1116 ss-1]|nr:pseudouridine synthase [Panus rudis PR-1116 ss-1]
MLQANRLPVRGPQCNLLRISERFSTSHCALKAQLHRNVSSLLYIDKGVIVINKPPGLVCQFDKNEEVRLSSPLVKPITKGDVPPFKSFLQDLQRSLQLKRTPIPIHRLDKLTTGAFLVARDIRSARNVSGQFQSPRGVTKKYIALVRGGEKSFPGERGNIANTFVFKDGRVSLVTSEADLLQADKSKEALTEWELLASSPKAPSSLVRLNLLTGVKHQLRVHMAKSLHAPILGDTLYSKARLSPKVLNVVNVPEGHMYLHAHELSFDRFFPKSHRITVTAPLPGYFTRLCAKLDITLSSEMTCARVLVDGEEVKGGVKALLEQFNATNEAAPPSLATSTSVARS